MLTAKKELTMKRTLILGSVFAIFTSVSAIAASHSNLGFEYQVKQKRLAKDQIQLVNINTATHAELMNLHGIDSEKANSIIAYRQGHGQFTSFTQLSTVEGIGGKLVEINTYQLSL